MSQDGGVGVAIVTGASSGIGRAVALRLAATGRTIVAAARRTVELDALAAEISNAGGHVVAVPTDVSRLEDIERLVKQAAAVGTLDALVNVAGLGRVHSVLADDADVEQLLTVNFLAPIRLMREVVPIMRAQGHGSIVNIGSIAGEVGVDGPHSASKFGLRGMTDSVRRELIGTGAQGPLAEEERGPVTGQHERNAVTPPLQSTALVAGGLVWALGTLQYFVCQIVVAAAWPTPYSLHNNFISDLGNTMCGPFAVSHGVPIEVCSPEHAVMNASFVTAGILTMAGAVLLRRFWPSGSSRPRALCSGSSPVSARSSLGSCRRTPVPDYTCSEPSTSPSAAWRFCC
jgi:NAD(P)-dependent dehydrogenase (short-subunit alcohol dehydrogenase family)